MRDLGDVVLAGRYRMERPVGRGATSSVWLARDQLLHRAVAAKLLDLGLASNRENVARFQREARRAVGLHRPYVVGGHDWGELPSAYLVMRSIG